MSPTQDNRRQPHLYWNQLLQLKAAAICVRLYRNKLARQVRWVNGIKAVGSSGGIAAWVVWKDYPLIWSGIIAAAQLLDALKNIFPFSKDHKAASDLTIAMELICIDAEHEWEEIYTGHVPDEAINKRRTQLRKLQLEAEQKHFPEGFEPSEKTIKLATEEAQTYFSLTYKEEPSS